MSDLHPDLRPDLHPPTLACIPIDPSEYNPELGRQWIRARSQWRADGTPDPAIYSGSIILHCQRCRIRVGVGPKQQAICDLAKKEYGLEPIILCLMCSVTEMQSRSAASGEPTIVRQAPDGPT